jgi:hypothetical protein
VHLFKPGDDLTASIQSKMMLWTSGLVVGLGVIIIAMMLEPMGPNLKNGSLSQSELLRGPASVGSAPYSTLALDSTNGMQAADFKLSCTPGSAGSATTATFSASIKQLRLSGDVCTPKVELLKSEIQNTSNGFSATVFVSSPRSFTTDYISLMDGPNAIHIKQFYKDGTTSDFGLEISRAPASINE